MDERIRAEQLGLQKNFTCHLTELDIDNAHLIVA